MIWDVNWPHYDLDDVFKLCCIDTGIGMTGPEMVEYINKLSSSLHQQSSGGNFGVGAKIAAASRNPHGIVYMSWKEGVGHMIHLWFGRRKGLWPEALGEEPRRVLDAGVERSQTGADQESRDGGRASRQERRPQYDGPAAGHSNEVSVDSPLPEYPLFPLSSRGDSSRTRRLGNPSSRQSQFSSRH